MLELEEMQVKISMDKEIAFDSPNTFILDFHIDERGIVLLAVTSGDYMIHSFDQHMTLIQTLPLNFHPGSLFLDCFDHLHLVTKDSLYQLENVKNDRLIYARAPIVLYEQFYKNCAGSQGNLVFLESLENHNQTTVYTSIDTNNGHWNLLYRIEDSMLVRSANDTDALIWHEGYSDTERLGEIDSEILKDISRRQQRLDFFQQIVSQPAYNPLFVTKDTTYIFDHLHGKLILFDADGDHFGTKSITYHLNSTWEKKLLLDKVDHVFYALEREKGELALCRLNPVNFTLDRRINVAIGTTPKKMLVHDGYCYFLYKAGVNDVFNKLFRLRL